MKLLGIEVSDQLVERWRSYLAPEHQPFFVGANEGWDLAKATAGDHVLTDDLRDTYKVWRMTDAKTVLWLDETAFMALPRTDRARLVRAQVERNRGAVPTVRRWRHLVDGAALGEQADGHRFVWWPSLLGPRAREVLADHVSEGQTPSRHREVKVSTWRRCERLLPGAHELAGTFADASGPNCFATTLGAAGRSDPEAWILQEPFEEFLSTSCERGGRDEDPGTILVWRDSHGSPVHSAVTIGDGWALEKPAQTWWAPRVVLGVRELIKANRWPGQRLERHRIVD